MSRSTSSHTAPQPTVSVTAASPPTPSLISARLPRRAAFAALLLPLAACAGDSEGTGDPGAAGDPRSDGGGAGDGAVEGFPSDSTGSADSLTVADPWVKAAEEGMSACFGTLINGTEQDLVLSGARTAASSRVELHETTADGSGGMSMQEKEGGFPLPAGGELVLEPGGNHLMLMDLTAALLPGDEVELILEFEDGTEQPFTATVKDFAGAQEKYEHEEDQ
ncbi:copper chaperone PCu(A)C [Brachybacterium sp. AOP24-D1-21]|uniref:copper chaperone PCu(A)C n=1 Tax=Brachybacterium sp. AOP24-D1-21 TaxID=3457711 RepID=UPI004033A52A